MTASHPRRSSGSFESRISASRNQQASARIARERHDFMPRRNARSMIVSDKSRGAGETDEHLGIGA
jgi:hypothetical protein